MPHCSKWPSKWGISSRFLLWSHGLVLLRFSILRRSACAMFPTSKPRNPKTYLITLCDFIRYQRHWSACWKNCSPTQSPFKEHSPFSHCSICLCQCSKSSSGGNGSRIVLSRRSALPRVSGPLSFRLTGTSADSSHSCSLQLFSEQQSVCWLDL